LIVGSGSYEMGLDAPDAKTYPACNKNWSWDCFMAVVPSGTAAQPTRILGSGWDRGCTAPPELWGSEHSAQVVSLDGSSNVTLACLEITDHGSCIESHLGGNSPDACNRTSPPFGAWASRGIYARDSSNVTLQDLNIHGLANRGILAINELVLQRYGHTWDSSAVDLAKSTIISDAATIAFKVLSNKLRRFPLFGIKEPRMCRLLPFWKPIIARTNSGLPNCIPTSSVARRFAPVFQLFFDLARVAQRFDLRGDVVAAIGDDAFQHADAVFHLGDPAGVLGGLFSAVLRGGGDALFLQPGVALHPDDADDHQERRQWDKDT